MKSRKLANAPTRIERCEIPRRENNIPVNLAATTNKMMCEVVVSHDDVVTVVVDLPCREGTHFVKTDEIVSEFTS